MPQTGDLGVGGHHLAVGQDVGAADLDQDTRPELLTTGQLWEWTGTQLSVRWALAGEVVQALFARGAGRAPLVQVIRGSELRWYEDDGSATPRLVGRSSTGTAWVASDPSQPAGTRLIVASADGLVRIFGLASPVAQTTVPIGGVAAAFWVVPDAQTHTPPPQATPHPTDEAMCARARERFTADRKSRLRRRRKRHAALPNLIIIGGLKCGTTSIHHYLGLHPEGTVRSFREVKHYRRRKRWLS